MKMHTKNLNKISDIFVILVSLCFIVNAAIKYFLLNTLSLEKFIIATSFFSICAVTSFLFFLGKVSSFKDIVNKKDKKMGDIVVGFLGLIFGIIGFYMGVSFEMNILKKIILIYGSIFFSLAAIAYLLIKFFEQRQNKTK